MPITHTTVSLKGFYFEDSMLTVKLSGLSGTTDSRTVVGKAVSIDATAANTFKLAADGDVVLGRLESFENRTIEGIVVGTVAFRFANILPIKTGSTVAVGDTVVGAGAGEIKAAGAVNYAQNFVAEIIGTNAVVVKI